MCKIDITFAQYLKICAMDNKSTFNQLIKKSIVENWDFDALTDYKGATLQYKDVARKIEKLHIIMEQIGIAKGDKVAICGRNSAHWGVAFLATLTYGAVAVPILHEFNHEQIHNIVNHSDSRILFVGDVVSKNIDAEQMPNIEGIVHLPDFSLLMSRSEKLTYCREHLNELFGKKFPRSFRKEDVDYYDNDEEELALINYTSGTTGHSKGVMLPYRGLTGNVEFCIEFIGDKMAVHSNTLSILPMAHMYGMAIEFLYPIAHGCHIYFLTRLPSPAIIAQAFADVKPSIVIAVPLIIEKIIRKKVFPKIENNLVRLLLTMPVISKKVKHKICEQVYEAFGGNAYEVIIGGAPLNKEVEDFLKSINFPYTVGYGTTECAPLISYRDWQSFAPGSCGRPVSDMEVRILSRDPQNVEGEIVTRGRHLMLGYYKNEEATREAIDEDGWYHTGDLGTMDYDGNIFIRGRKKNMLLSANGQNVYPEEIEDKLNSMALVSESIVIQKGDKFVALIHPDYDEATTMAFSDEDISKVMEQNRQELNNQLPAYSKLASFEIHREEFAKTPKKSIKRYLYQNV